MQREKRSKRTILPADGDGAIGVSKVGGEGHAGEDSNLEYTSKPVRVIPSQRDEAEKGKGGDSARLSRKRGGSHLDAVEELRWVAHVRLGEDGVDDEVSVG